MPSGFLKTTEAARAKAGPTLQESLPQRVISGHFCGQTHRAKTCGVGLPHPCEKVGCPQRRHGQPECNAVPQVFSAGFFSLGLFFVCTRDGGMDCHEVPCPSDTRHCRCTSRMGQESWVQGIQGDGSSRRARGPLSGQAPGPSFCLALVCQKDYSRLHAQGTIRCWGLNLGPPACKTCTQPFETHLQPFTVSLRKLQRPAKARPLWMLTGIHGSAGRGLAGNRKNGGPCT